MVVAFVAGVLVAWATLAGDKDMLSADEGWFLLDTGNRPVPAPGFQWHPASAFDGTRYLVVWQDHRGDHSVDTEGPTRVYGTRVTPDGVVLDTNGIAISPAWCSHPAVAFGDGVFFVVWGGGHGVGCARVTQDGLVLDTNAIVISLERHGPESMAVVFDGTDFVVTWQRLGDDDMNREVLRQARISRTGAVLDTVSITDSRSVVKSAPSGTVYAEPSRGNGMDVWFKPKGAADGRDRVLASQAAYGQWSPAVASDGESYLVVWEDDRDYSDIYGARVAQDGTVLDPGGIVISRADHEHGFPALAFDGENYLVVWTEWRAGRYTDDCRGIVGSGLRAARVTKAGAVLDTSGFSLVPDAWPQGTPAMVFDGERHLVVWKHDQGERFEIRCVRVTPQGGTLDSSPILVSGSMDYCDAPSVGFDGAGFLVEWKDSNGGAYAARVSREGTVSAERAVAERIPTSRSTGREIEVREAWAGTVEGKRYNNYRIWVRLVR